MKLSIGKILSYFFREMFVIPWANVWESGRGGRAVEFADADYKVPSISTSTDCQNFCTNFTCKCSFVKKKILCLHLKN